MIKAFAPPGGDWDKNGIHPRPLHHPCVNKRGGPQGDLLTLKKDQVNAHMHNQIRRSYVDTLQTVTVNYIYASPLFTPNCRPRIKMRE